MIVILTFSADGKSVIAYIYDKHHKKMLYTAAKMLGQERAEDAVHDVFLRMLERFENEYEVLRDKPGLYFVVSIRNHSLNLMARERNNTVSIDDDILQDTLFSDSSETPESLTMSKEGHDVLVSLIRRLNPTMRQVLEYKYLLEYSNKEIAEILGLNESAVSSRIDRAKRKLQEFVMKHEELNDDLIKS